MYKIIENKRKAPAKSTAGEWEEMKNFWSYSVKDTELFDPKSYRYFAIRYPVDAVMGKLKGGKKYRIKSLRFPKHVQTRKAKGKKEKDFGWTKKTAQEWLQEHPDFNWEISGKEWQNLGPELLSDYDKKTVKMLMQSNPDTKYYFVAIAALAAGFVVPVMIKAASNAVSENIPSGRVGKFLIRNVPAAIAAFVIAGQFPEQRMWGYAGGIIALTFPFFKSEGRS